MKKFMALLAAAILPFAVYIGFFVAFEPNNYFGLKLEDTMFSRIMSFKNEKPQSIIIGDSRLANFDMSIVSETSGREWHNLAFGGASLEESLDLLEYARSENNALKEIVLGVSFYTINGSYGTVSRMATIEKQINNPAAYITNFQYNIDAAVNFANIIKGVPLGSEHETAQWTQADYTQHNKALPFRKNLIAYSSLLYTNCAKAGTLQSSLSSIDAMLSAMEDGSLNAATLVQEMLSATPSQSSFFINEEQLLRLVEISEDCEREGIQLTIVLPPMHKSVRELVCVPLGIDTQMQEALKIIASAKAQILDYEWQSSASYDDDAFFDGFHLDLVYGLPQWTKTFFSEV